MMDMNTIGWAIFTAAAIYADAVRFQKLGAFYPYQSGFGIAIMAGVFAMIVTSFQR